MIEALWWILGTFAVFAVFFALEWLWKFWISWPFEQ